MAFRNTTYRAKIDDKVLDSIKRRIYAYLKYHKVSTADENLDWMNQVEGLYVENFKEIGGPFMQSRHKPNEIVIDKMFVSFGSNGNIVGLNDKLRVLIRSQIGHELLHSCSWVGGYSGVKTNNVRTAMNEGFTQLFTEDIFGYVVSNNTDGYWYYKKIAKILEASVGKSVCLESYFGDSPALENEVNKLSGDNYYSFLCFSLNGFSGNGKNINLKKHCDLITKNVIFNVVIPKMRLLSEQQRKDYLKEIISYVNDDFSFVYMFIDLIEKYLEMSPEELLNEKNNNSKELFDESVKLSFYKLVFNKVDYLKYCVFLPNGEVQVTYNNLTFKVDKEPVLDEIYFDYFVKRNNLSEDNLNNLRNKVSSKINSDDLSINFKNQAISDVCLRFGNLAAIKKFAKEENKYIGNSYSEIANSVNLELRIENLSNNRPLTFDELKSLVERYDIEQDGYFDSVIVDKQNGKAVDNPEIIKNVRFAFLWISASYGKVVEGEEYGYAFNDASRRVYDELCNLVHNSLKETGTIDTQSLYDHFSNDTYKYSDKIVYNLMDLPVRVKMLYVYFVNCYKDSIIETKRPLSLNEHFKISDLTFVNNIDDMNFEDVIKFGK